MNLRSRFTAYLCTFPNQGIPTLKCAFALAQAMSTLAENSILMASASGAVWKVEPGTPLPAPDTPCSSKLICPFHNPWDELAFRAAEAERQRQEEMRMPVTSSSQNDEQPRSSGLRGGNDLRLEQRQARKERKRVRLS